MRIDELTLLAYGKFTEHKLGFPRGKHDFHVIAGPNEAGKSTVRRAIVELLFGMERQSPLGFKHPQSDLRISAVLEATSGKLSFMRTKQQKSLRSLTGEALPDSYLDPALGSLTQEAFEQLHCLDHERLLKGGQGIVDPRNSVSQILFQAASGLDTFAAIREALGDRAVHLFAHRGRHSEYVMAVDRYATAQRTLRDVQVRTRDWVEARDALKNSDEALEQERNSRGNLELQRSAWERARRLAPLVEKLDRLKEELLAMGDTVNFPSNAKETLNAGISAVNAAAGVVETREKDVHTREQDVRAIVVDQNVLEHTADIDRFSELCGLYANHPRDLLLRRNEVTHWVAEVLARGSDFGWGTSEEEVRKLVPQEKLLRTIDTLIKERGALVEGERGARETVDARRAAIDELQKRFESTPETRVDPQLAQALVQAMPYKNSESKQKTLLFSASAAETTLKHALAALGRTELTVELLRLTPLPSLDRISALRAARREIATQVELTGSRMDEAEDAIADLELRVTQFERSHKIVTVSEVTQSRRERDTRWNAIKSGALALSEGATQLDIAIRLADELVDARTLSETDSATLENLRNQLETVRDAQRRHADTLGSRGQQLQEFDAQWSALTSQMGLHGMELDDMPEWLTKRDIVLAAAESHAGKKHDYEQERDSAAHARGELFAALIAAGLPVNEASGLASLCTISDEHIKGVDRSRALRESLQQQLRDAQNSLRSAEHAGSEKSAAAQGWNAKWQEALTKANLGSIGSVVADVEAAVQAAGFIRQRLDKIDAQRVERIDAMEADLALRKSTAQVLAESLAPGIAPGTPDDLSRVLSAKLEEAKRQSHRQLQAQKFLDETKRQLSEARSMLEQARHRIEPLMKAAGVGDPMLALPLIEKSQRKAEVEASLTQTHEALEEGSDGLTIAHVKAEVEGHPASEAPGRLLEIKSSLEDSDRKLTEFVQSQIAARQKLHSIDGGDRAAIIEAQRQEALADMSEAGEEYLQVATASSLLKWAVDKYRDRKQGPLLQRASTIFKILTRDSFEKLRIDYDQPSPVLLAYRTGGQLVNVSGLSDGTRDQLFLALRIAALELQTEQSHPVPFVADDLFINFDDKRSQAGLQALYELSTKTQVLFLSHQEHLLPVVKKLFANVNIITLNNVEVPA